VNQEDIVPYLLLVTAAVVAMIGLVKLRSTGPHGTPWGALLVWASLFGLGLTVWLVSSGLH
jgi:hypothetical protein